MGTRGTYGVRVNGKDKLMYNHFDSYPSNLGVDMLNFLKFSLKEKSRVWLTELSEKLEMVIEDARPTAEQMDVLKNYVSLSEQEIKEGNWYGLLRPIQGDLSKALALGFGVENPDFIKDSLFCEWGYIINLDEGKFEVYKGFQKHAHNLGRYAGEESDQDNYFPCALIAVFDFENLPEEDEFKEIIGEICGDDE